MRSRERRDRGRFPGGLAGRVGVLLLGSCLLACPQPGGGDRGTPPVSSLEITAMSFNIRWDGFDDGRNNWKYRRESVFEVIRSAEPDVVGLQEASETQIADLLEALPRYRVFNSGERSVVVSVLYLEDRFRLDRGGAFWLVEESELSGGTRRCTWVRLVEKTTGLAFRHFNFHLDHRSLPSRERSVVELSRHLGALEHPDPFVVTGDFNTAEDSPPMKYLRGEVPLPDEDGTLGHNPVPLRDSYLLAHPGAKDVGTGHGFTGRRHGPKIDHVLVRPTARVTAARILYDERDGLYPSDHFPVLGRVVFESR